MTGAGFELTICGDDVSQRKPHPDQLLLAAEQLGESSDGGSGMWGQYDGCDCGGAGRADGVFLQRGAVGSAVVEYDFSGNEKYPYKPDVVVNDFSEFWALVLACLE